MSWRLLLPLILIPAFALMALGLVARENEPDLGECLETTTEVTRPSNGRLGRPPTRAQAEARQIEREVCIRHAREGVLTTQTDQWWLLAGVGWLVVLGSLTPLLLRGGAGGSDPTP